MYPRYGIFAYAFPMIACSGMFSSSNSESLMSPGLLSPLVVILSFMFTILCIIGCSFPD